MNASSKPGQCALDVLNADQFVTALRQQAKAMVPEQPPATNMLERLAPYRATFVDLRKQGYSLNQLVTLLRNPAFNVDVSVATMRRLLGRTPRRHRRTDPVVKHKLADMPPENASSA